jgi:hypothetical protein
MKALGHYGVMAICGEQAADRNKDPLLRGVGVGL